MKAPTSHDDTDLAVNACPFLKPSCPPSSLFGWLSVMTLAWPPTAIQTQIQRERQPTGLGVQGYSSRLDIH